jgi:putative lysine transport system permease protein
MPTTFFGWIGFLIVKYLPLFLQGTGTTILIAIAGTVFGFIIGTLVAIVRTIPLRREDNLLKKILLKAARFILTSYVEVFRNTPMMVQAMLIYYGSFQYFGIDMSPIFAGIFIVSINTGAYMAEIVRGGIISVDPGQTEGAQSIGMTHWQAMINVILPQALRNIMPSIGNEFVINIKDSSVLSVISVAELFFMAKSAAGTYYRYFEAMIIACVIYFIVNFTITRVLLKIEKKMDGPDSYNIKGSQNMTAEEEAQVLLNTKQPRREE